MNVFIVVHRIYTHLLKANNLSFRLMYISLIYDDQKCIFDDDAHHQIHQNIPFVIAMNVSIVVHRIYTHR